MKGNNRITVVLRNGEKIDINLPKERLYCTLNDLNINTFLSFTSYNEDKEVVIRVSEVQMFEIHKG